MENCKKKPLFKLLILFAGAALMVSGLAGCGKAGEDTLPSQEVSANTLEVPTETTEEAPAIPLPTKYIVLSYPKALQEDVKVSYEDQKDGQKIIFTTGFTGEDLELFHFIISKSDSAGYLLGTLEDAQAGEMFVCVNVCEYAAGNWEVADYQKLNELQSRVNDIIVQFHEDDRFTPVR